MRYGPRPGANLPRRPNARRTRQTEGCQSGRSGRSRKPLSVQAFRGFESHPLRQSLPAQQSPGPFGTAEKPRKRGLLQTKLLTATSARNAVLVSLSPVVSKAPDFAILVRNFKGLILNGYSAQKVRTFRILLVTRGVLRWKMRISKLPDALLDEPERGGVFDQRADLCTVKA